jgi:hypothetical protein
MPIRKLSHKNGALWTTSRYCSPYDIPLSVTLPRLIPRLRTVAFSSSTVVPYVENGLLFKVIISTQIKSQVLKIFAKI